MKHQSVNQIRTYADVRGEAVRPMSSRERLERWAKLLEAEPNRRLATLRETEFRGVEMRERMRGDNSPISLAFADPVLRDEGLRDDTYGEAKRFFGISDWRLHDILCNCHFGESVSSLDAARGVRRASAAEARSGFFGRIRQAFAGLRPA